MADIRINSLSTTASASSSDDFIALDGTTNGTRKLSAYSPTFGGNVTISGGLNLTNSSTNSYIYDGTGWIWTSNGLSSGTVKGGIYTAGGSLFLTANSSLATNRFFLDSSGNATVAGNLTVSGTGTSTIGGDLTVTGTGGGVSSIGRVGLNGIGPAGVLSITSDAKTAADAIGLTFLGKDSANNAQTYAAIRALIEDPTSTSEDGALQLFTVSAGTVAEKARLTSTGNYLVGTTTDGGQKLQVAGTVSLGLASATGILTVQSDGPNSSWKASTSGGALWNRWLTSAGVRRGYYGYASASDSTFTILNEENGSLVLGTNNATALTLDTSQNATLAGNYFYVGGGTSFYLRATGSGNGLWYGNNVSVDANYFLVRNQAGSTSYFSVDSTGATFAGSVNINGGSKNFRLTDTAITNTSYNTLSAYAYAQNVFAIGVGSSTGTPSQITIAGNTNLVTFGGAVQTAAPTSGTAKTWKLGEVANVSPTSPNKTIRVEIDGTVYFIAAKTTND